MYVSHLNQVPQQDAQIIPSDVPPPPCPGIRGHVPPSFPLLSSIRVLSGSLWFASLWSHVSEPKLWKRHLLPPQWRRPEHSADGEARTPAQRPCCSLSWHLWGTDVRRKAALSLTWRPWTISRATDLQGRSPLTKTAKPLKARPWPEVSRDWRLQSKKKPQWCYSTLLLLLFLIGQ